MCSEFVIITWQDLYAEDMMLAVDDRGKVLIFKTHKEAEAYSEDNLNFNWKIIEIEF